MLRTKRLVFVGLFVLVAGIFVLPKGSMSPMKGWSLSPATAEAREKKQRSLFKILFGRKKASRKAVRKRKRARPRQTRRAGQKRRVKRRNTVRRKTVRRSAKRSTASRAAAVQPARETVEKADDAKIVLVVGDFFAGGLADGLKVLLSDAPGVVVEDRTNGLSGLIRTDVVDWPQTLPKLVEETKPSYIVYLAGSNDRQLIRMDGQKLKTRSEAWDAEYKSRVTEMATTLKATNLPYTWVGLPPVRFKSTSKDWLYFNEQYAAVAPSEKGKFVDVWDGFSDPDGNYARSGPDVSGQITLLRAKDGINLTKAGKRRLAFYVEKDIRRALDGLSVPGAEDVADFGIEDAAQDSPAYDPEGTGRTIVVNLSDPAADGNDVLAGEKVEIGGRTTTEPKPVDIDNSSSSASQPDGRADRFDWPLATLKPAKTPAAVAETTAPRAAARTN